MSEAVALFPDPPAAAAPSPAAFPPPPRPVLEFDVAPADIPRLLRAPAINASPQGRARTTQRHRIWYDTAAGTLRGQNLALSQQATVWRLERLSPESAADWPPASPAEIIAEANDPAHLSRKLPAAVIADLVPVAAFAGTRRRVTLTVGGEPARLDVLEGVLRGVAHDEPACRLILAGPAPAMAALATQLATQIRLSIPRASLAARAIALVQGTALPPRQLGAPEIPGGQTVADALLLVVSHLTDVILHWSILIPPAAEATDPEPVHQMRVAVRRLRSALAIFRRAAATEEAAALFRGLGQDLKALAAILGEARDWDVFLDGAGAAVADAFRGDKRIAGLLAAAARKRQAAYAALTTHLHGDAWRHFALRLALLPTARPWAETPPQPGDRDEYGQLRLVDPHASLLAAPADAYASHALQRSFKRTIGTGEDLSTLDAEALHDARKRAKQLRYACEFFAPLFPAKPVRRFLARLEAVQEDLGAVNDSHVAASLMAQLGGGPDRSFATGVVQGYVAAINAPAAHHAGKAWAKLLKQPVFWD
jgi:CHAD domain-containing protein